MSIDDFGRGQTSSGHLSSLPVHELKIDRSFVWDMIENLSHTAIVRSIVDLNLCCFESSAKESRRYASLTIAQCRRRGTRFSALSSRRIGLVQSLTESSPYTSLMGTESF